MVQTPVGTRNAAFLVGTRLEFDALSYRQSPRHPRSKFTRDKMVEWLSEGTVSIRTTSLEQYDAPAGHCLAAKGYTTAR